MQEPRELRNNYVVGLFDVDGTLVERLVDTHVLDGKPTDAVANALQEFVDAGNVALISTGRGPRAILGNLRALPFSGMVAMDGAYVEVDGQVVVDSVLSDEAVQALLDFVEAEQLVVGFDGIVDSFSVSPDNSWQGAAHAFSSVADARAAFPRPVVEKANILVPREEQLESLRGAGELFELYYAGGRAYEAVARGVSKATGTRAALEVLPGKHGLTIGVGDSDNDLEMLDVCDLAVAMGNARESVKAAADVVVGDVAHDGVAEALFITRQLWK